MESKKISRALLRRLPLYLNYLKALPETSTNISAKALGNALGLGEVLVRKDLAKVSSGGRCKVGHPCQTLIEDIEAFLDYTSTTYAVLVGAGKLGQALLDYGGFEESGMDILAGFDVNPAVIRYEDERPVYPMSYLKEFCRSRDVRMGIITVPSAHAQDACDALVESGIEAIWNFAPTHLTVPDYVAIQNENLAASPTTLRLHLKTKDKKKAQ